MKYFIDTHDVAKGTFPEGTLTPEEFIETFSGFDKAGEGEGDERCDPVRITQRLRGA